MSALLHLSDPHFGTERPEVVEALLRFAREQQPALAVLSGDITQRARRRQFAAARDFVDRLGVPVLAIPGNHDVPLYNLAARLFAPYANYRRAFGDELEPVADTDDWLVIGVKTTRRRRHKDGEVSPQQIERVAARLAAARPGQLRIVVTHQPVSVTRRKDLTNVLHGAARAVPRWAAAGCDLILGGHIHLPFVQALAEEYEGLPRAVWAVQAGTAVSWRIREGADNSVNVLRRGEGGGRQCVVERWDYARGAGEFERVAVTVVRVEG